MRAEARTPARNLIIAYGNPLRGDDGAGDAVAQRLRDERLLADGAVDIVTVVQLTPDLALDVSGAAAVVFVDAGADVQPGAVVVREVRPAADASAWTHHVTPESLVTLADALYGATPPASLVTVGAASFEAGDPLSDAVAGAVAEAAVAVIAVLSAGHPGTTVHA